jgi:anti-sigma factor RsiW
MNCDDLAPLMEAYLDSELDTRAAVELAAHLDACANCAATFAAARRDNKRVAAFLLQPPPEADSAPPAVPTTSSGHTPPIPAATAEENSGIEFVGCRIRSWRNTSPHERQTAC